MSSEPIIVDMREGSYKLLPALQKMGLPATEADPPLDSGDLFFMGRGEKGAPVTVGIEHKTLADLISSLRTERLQGHQLIKMRGAKEGEAPAYDFAFLLFEGELLYDAKGTLMRWTERKGRKELRPIPGGMKIGELFKRLLVLHLCGGLIPIPSHSRRDSLRWIEALYHAFTDTDLDKHKSHLAMYLPPTLVVPTQFEETVRTLPGVGMKVAKAAAKVFTRKGKPSIRRALNANSDEWAEIVTQSDKGQQSRVGKVVAQKIIQAVE